MSPRVLFEDNHLLVVDKPAGLLSQGDETGDPSLVDWAEAYRKKKESKPGNVYVGLVHRLDRPVSGIVVLAKTSKAAARLSDQFRQRRVRKLYLAVVPRRPNPLPANTGELWQDALDRPDVSTRSQSPSPGKTKQDCQTRVRWAASSPRWALLVMEPITGRKHQLRQQAALRGLPIAGDTRYGSADPMEGIALHAGRITFEHPTKREPFTCMSPPPAHWSRFGFSSSEIDLALNDGDLNP